MLSEVFSETLFELVVVVAAAAAAGVDVFVMTSFSGKDESLAGIGSERGAADSSSLTFSGVTLSLFTSEMDIFLSGEEEEEEEEEGEGGVVSWGDSDCWGESVNGDSDCEEREFDDVTVGADGEEFSEMSVGGVTSSICWSAPAPLEGGEPDVL